MRTRIRGFAVTVALGAVALCVSGCSLIGLAVGSRTNHTWVNAVLADSAEVRGDFAALDTLGLAAGAPGGAGRTEGRSTLLLAGDDGSVPQRLEAARLRRAEGHRGRLVLTLDDDSRVECQRVVPAAAGGDPDSTPGAGSGPARWRPSSLLLATDVPGDLKIRDGAASWGRPAHWDTARVALDQLRELRPKRTQKGTWIGLGVGLALDALAFLGLAIAMSGFQVGL
ncbi:MAG TPA: hypothetical protein VMS93_13435 [Candidatus Saccharimonadales bacterium]|nr:hypothetical protein [Candidatus Saccharimonadales bacterium]